MPRFGTLVPLVNLTAVSGKRTELGLRSMPPVKEVEYSLIDLTLNAKAGDREQTLKGKLLYPMPPDTERVEPTLQMAMLTV